MERLRDHIVANYNIPKDTVQKVQKKRNNINTEKHAPIMLDVASESDSDEQNPNDEQVINDDLNLDLEFEDVIELPE